MTMPSRAPMGAGQLAALIAGATHALNAGSFGVNTTDVTWASEPKKTRALILPLRLPRHRKRTRLRAALNAAPSLAITFSIRTRGPRLIEVFLGVGLFVNLG